MPLRRQRTHLQRATEEELAMYDVPSESPEPAIIRSGLDRITRSSGRRKRSATSKTQCYVEVPTAPLEEESTSRNISRNGTGHSRGKTDNRGDASADTRECQLNNPISSLDPGDYWLDIVKMSKELKYGCGLESVAPSVRRLEAYLTSTPSTKLMLDSEQLHESFQGIKEHLDTLVATNNHVYHEFVEGGLKELMDLLRKLFDNHSNLFIPDQQSVSVLKPTADLVCSIVSLGERIRTHRKVLTNSLPKRESSIIARLRSLYKCLQREIDARERMLQQRLYTASLQEAHRQIRIRDEAAAEDRRKRVRSTVPITETDTPLTENLPRTVISGNAHPSAIVWTVKMDEELLQSLFTYRDLPLPERYQHCLLSPSLQNLLEKHVYDRALFARPSWVASYEDEGQSVPSWVNSIQ